MNEERKIAQAILDAQKYREESYVVEGDFGEYKREIEDCLMQACKEQSLSPNIWVLLGLAMHWWNDIQLWAEDVIAGRKVIDQMLT